MTKILKYLLPLSLLFIFSGCGDLNLYHLKHTEQVVVPSNPIEDKIVIVLSTASKDDCITLYKLFSGISLYLEKSTSLKKTTDVFELLNKVETEYGWTKKSIPALTQVVKDDLKNQGFEDPKILDDTVKQQIIKTFNSYANACKTAALSKKAKEVK